MSIQPADRPHRETSLACLVVGGQPPLAARLIAQLERSARVGSAERLLDPTTLEHALTARRQDLVVYVLHAPDEPLPRCLASNLDTRVLVVAPDGIAGTLARWLQQGANDLVSPEDDDGLAHALSRLLDECALAATVRRQQTIIDTQRARIDTLLAASQRTSGTDCATADGTSATAASQPLAGPIMRQTKGQAIPRPGAQNASLSIGFGRRADGAASTSSPARARGARTSRVTGSADGLPGRRESLRRLLALQARGGHGARQDATPESRLRAGDEPQAIALQLTLPVDATASSGDAGNTRIARTLADLAIYRAAEAVRGCLPRRLLLGRTRGDTLIVLFTGEPALQRHAAIARLRRSLGTLGGLLERPEEIAIDTVHAPLSRLATPDLLERLERRRRERGRRLSETDDHSVVQILPVLQVRPDACGPSSRTTLAAARS